VNLLSFQPPPRKWVEAREGRQPRPHARGKPDVPVMHATQGDAAVETRATPGSLGVLLGSHNLRDGEIVLLLVNPSVWFIVLSSLRFAAAVLILLISAILLDEHLPGPNKSYIEVALIVLAGRVMWAVLQWMGRVYILTNLRILRLSGVFNVNIFDCPLRKVGRTRVVRTMRERIFRIGSIEIVPCDEQTAPALWQMIARPEMVHDQIVAAIYRAKQGRLTAV
jgi:hypothetical protein